MMGKHKTLQINVKLKQCLYRLGQSQRVPGGWGSQSSRESAHEGCQPYAPATFTPTENIPDTHFCLKLSRPKGHSAAGRIMLVKSFNDTIGNRTGVKWMYVIATAALAKRCQLDGSCSGPIYLSATHIWLSR